MIQEEGFWTFINCLKVKICVFRLVCLVRSSVFIFKEFLYNMICIHRVEKLVFTLSD